MQKVLRIIKTIIIKIVGYLTLKLFLIPVSKKYEKKYAKIDKLQRILTISEVDKKGGAAKVGYTLHHELVRKGINSNMLVNIITEPEEKISQLKQRSDIFSKILNIYADRYKWFDFFKLSSFDILKTKEFKEVDLVHLHNIHLNFFSKFALPKLTSHKRTIWTLHDSLDLFADYPDLESKTGEMDFYSNLPSNQRKKLRDISRRIINNSYLTVVAPSQWLLDKAKGGIFKNADIRLIHNGVNEDIFKPRDQFLLRKELNLPTNKKILLFSAAWGLTEGTKDSTNTILQLYEALKDNHEVNFVILGGSDEHFKDEKSINVPYISDQELLSKYYSAADLFIYPSLWDNLPLAVIENMAVGIPVITYNTGGIPELVEHMKTGYVAQYNNSEDFIAGVKSFLQNKELRESASKESIRIFKENFTQTQMVNNYMNLYNELIKR